MLLETFNSESWCIEREKLIPWKEDATRYFHEVFTDRLLLLPAIKKQIMRLGWFLKICILSILKKVLKVPPSYSKVLLSILSTIPQYETRYEHYLQTKAHTLVANVALLEWPNRSNLHKHSITWLTPPDWKIMPALWFSLGLNGLWDGGLLLVTLKTRLIKIGFLKRICWP